MIKKSVSFASILVLQSASIVAHASPTDAPRIEIPSHRFDVAFHSHGLEVLTGGAPIPFTMRLSSVGCAAHAASVTKRVPVGDASPVEENDGVTLRHALSAGGAGLSGITPSNDTLDEWYRRTPFGLEQGFSIPGSECDHPDEMFLDLSVGAGWVAGWLERGKTVRLVDLEGNALRYGGLVVNDAGGRVVSSSIELTESGIRLVMDTRGAVFPLTVDPILGNLVQTLTASDGMSNDQFGSAVAVSGDTLVAGAPQKTTSVSFSGEAYVFTRQNGAWLETQKIVGSDLVGGDLFGASLSLDGNTLAVSAFNQSDAGLGFSHGAVYVFARSGSVWAQQAKLVPSNPSSGMYFGVGISLSGNTLAIGAPNSSEAATNAGAVYVFTRVGSTWTEQAKLIPADLHDSDSLGASVAISGDTLMASASSDDLGSWSGAVYVYTRSGTTWALDNKLLASDGTTDTRFGSSVALQGTKALIGAFKTPDPNGALGAVYSFEHKQGAWLQQQIIFPPALQSSSGFGSTTAISGNLAVVGEPHYNSGGGAGSLGAMTALAHGSTWSQGTRVVPPGSNASNTNYGQALALDGNTAVMGGQASNVLVYTLVLGNGASCADASQCGTGFCVSGYCCNSACGNGVDPCQACSVASGSPADGTCVQLDTPMCQTAGTGGTSGTSGSAGTGGTGGTGGIGGTAGVGGGGTGGVGGVGGTSAGTAGSSSMACIPGLQVVCACPGGVSGVQVCNAAGTAFDACQCPMTGGTAGTDGAGGVGGTAGMGGNSGTSGTAGQSSGAAGTAGTSGTAGNQANPAINPTSDDSGGCGCDVPGQSRTSPALAGLGILVAVAGARRRRSAPR